MRFSRSLAPLALATTILLSAPAAMAAGGAGPIAPNKAVDSSEYTVVAAYEHIPAAAVNAVITAAQNDAYESLKHEPGTLSVHVVPDPVTTSRLVVAATFKDKHAFEVHEHGWFERGFRAVAALKGASRPVTTIAGTSLTAATGGKEAHEGVDEGGSVFTVVAEFDNVQPQWRDDFIAIAQADGYGSLTGEPGTLGFFFVPDPADPTRFVFLETFTSLDAFVAHKLDTPAQAYLDLVARAGIVGPKFFVTGSDTGFDQPGGYSVPNQRS
ncbi:antibiotic biosynthesis monooxygenase [Streptomyces sp. NPDC051976]|uniref:putative quinol monooxygenase n=1 Tax=Streptomyces sp. NPDC051976 TaxID=3154947 RepID=UPI00343CD57E